MFAALFLYHYFSLVLSVCLLYGIECCKFRLQQHDCIKNAFIFKCQQDIQRIFFLLVFWWSKKYKQIRTYSDSRRIIRSSKIFIRVLKSWDHKSTWKIFVAETICGIWEQDFFIAHPLVDHEKTEVHTENLYKCSAGVECTDIKLEISPHPIVFHEPPT